MGKKSDYGILAQPNAKLQRNYFKEMAKLLGVNVMYQYPLQTKEYTMQGELDTGYSTPERVSCIFTEYVDQKTAKLLGWNAELQEQASLISVPYDLYNLQVGCLFEVPSAFDDAPGRKFRVVELSAKMMYPASITCKLVPYYETEVDKADTELFVNTNFNVLYNDEELGN